MASPLWFQAISVCGVETPPASVTILDHGHRSSLPEDAVDRMRASLRTLILDLAYPSLILHCLVLIVLL